MGKTYDPKCWDLAVHFLADVPKATDDDRRQLARDLQQRAEDAIFDIEYEPEQDDDYGAWVDDDDLPDDPPLYPPGKLASMSLEELEREHDRQSDRQGALGDAECIDDRAVEEAEMRCRLVQAEIARRQTLAEGSV